MPHERIKNLAPDLAPAQSSLSITNYLIFIQPENPE
jgi:hypothetical protein